MVRSLYLCLVSLHPAGFRQRFAEEMLWIFDQSAETEGLALLIADAAVSLVRQWLIRSQMWKWALASLAGLIPLLIAFGSFLPWDRVCCR
jgi:hypothetical protein